MLLLDLAFLSAGGESLSQPSGSQVPCFPGRPLARDAREFKTTKENTMKYSRPAILATAPAINTIQSMAKGLTPQIDSSNPQRTVNAAYEADE